MRTCFLHAGTHKTGTTSVQAFLADNAATFAAGGILVPLSGRSRSLFGHDRCGHHNIAWELNGDPRFTPSDGTLHDLLMEIATSSLESCVLSSEDFEYLHTRPERMRYMASALRSSGFEPQPLFVLRDQASYAESLYAELVKHGLRIKSDRFLASVSDSGHFCFATNWRFCFDYLQLLNAFAEGFTRTPRAVAYHSRGDGRILLENFAAELLPESGPGQWVLPPKLNPALSFGEVFTHLGGTVKDPSTCPEEPFRILTPDERTKVRTRFAASNAAVQLQYGIQIEPEGERPFLPYEARQRAINGLLNG